MNAAVNRGRHAAQASHRKQPGQNRYRITRPEVPAPWRHRQKLRLQPRRDWWVFVAVPVFTALALGAVFAVLKTALG